MANTSIRVDTVGLAYPWQLGQTYRVEIEEGFVNQDGGLRLPIAGGVLTSFTTPNNPPQISSTSPTHQSTANKGFENISFTIDRANVTVLGGYANLYLNTGNTLIKSFTVSNVNTSGNGTIYVTTLNIVGNLEANTKYYLGLTANIFLDSDGFRSNAVSNNGTFLFTTPVAPQVDSTSPANASVLSIGQTSATLTFDRPVFYNIGNIYLFKANTNQLLRTYNSSNINIAGNVASLSLTNAGIEANQKYYFTSNANVVYDTTRLKYPGLTTANTYNFFAPTTPQLTSTVPTNGTTVSPGFYQAQLVFDRNITANVGNLSLYNSDLSQLVSNIAITDPLVSISANVITANLAYKLDSNAHYYITTDANVVIDNLPLNYLGLTSTSTFTFTAPTAPLLVNTYPLTGNVSVYENESMYFTLDRNAYNNTGNLYLKKTSDNSIVKTLTSTSGITTNNAVVLLDVSGVMDPYTSYYLTTSANIVQDISGCKYPTISSNLISFTTSEFFNRDWAVELDPRRLITTTSYANNTYNLRFRTLNTIANIISSGSGGIFSWTVSGNTQLSNPQGYAGTGGALIQAGDDLNSRARGAGGGGGAGGSGNDVTNLSNIASDGGAGIISNITGVNVYYASGGGGGINGSNNAGGAGGGYGNTSLPNYSGGSGGTSGISVTTGNVGGSGINNTGGGGGGGSNFGFNPGQEGYAKFNGGSGGSGIVILRYIAGESNVTSATGGTITTNGEYTIHSFTNNGNLIITSNSAVIVEYLIVAGGGGGGAATSRSSGGGGGGAGGLKQGAIEITSNTYAIIVGLGGTAGNAQGSQVGAGGSGGNSSFNSITSSGGGGGGAGYTAGTGGGGSGGSGGGQGTGVGGSGLTGGGAGASYTQSMLGNCSIIGNVAQINSHFGNLIINPPGTYTKYYKLVNGAGEINYRLYPLTTLPSKPGQI